MITCPHCEGNKQNYVHVQYADYTGAWTWITCMTCKGAGTITEDHQARMEEGKRLQLDRRARGLTLGQEAARLEISVVELSKRERGEQAT